MSIKKDVLAHYDRMIEWAEKHPDEPATMNEMQINIGECWRGAECILQGQLVKQHCASVH